MTNFGGRNFRRRFFFVGLCPSLIALAVIVLFVRPHISLAEPMSPIGFFFAIASGTLISEDIATISAGVLAAQGQIGFALALGASFIGIFVGDVLLFVAGRIFGRRAARIAPLRWLFDETKLRRATAWFEKRGAWAIFVSRFTPGLRLPVYFSAGVLNTPAPKFIALFFLAALVWTPLLVFASAWLGGSLLSAFFTNENFFVGLPLAIVSIYVLIGLATRLATWRGRRHLIGAYRRIRLWEFWRWQIFYIPVFAYIGYLMIRFRSASVFTCVNPAIPQGGFVGERKDEILSLLARNPEMRSCLPKWILLSREMSQEEKLSHVRDFMLRNSLEFPVVVKPNSGQRGAGVFVVRNEDSLRNAIANSSKDLIVQEYAAGEEFGVFYFKKPSEKHGRIFSITVKTFPEVFGDGNSSLEELILRDERAVCMARSYFERHADRLDHIPKDRERVQLIEIGTHSRGAIFSDGADLITEALDKKFDELCTPIEGICFGRFDVRARSREDFTRGENFMIVELNGVTSESTNIYDKRYTLFDAYRILFRQWRLAFEIGAENRARGFSPTRIATLAKLIATEDY